MIKIEKETISGFLEAIRGMRNPMNSWEKSDSSIYTETKTCPTCEYNHLDLCKENLVIGSNDFRLMWKLCESGPDHRKFMRMITVWVDITAPLYWWKEFDTYKVGTVANSCSTMHKIHAKRFDRNDFSTEHLLPRMLEVLDVTIFNLNACRGNFLESNDKKWWWQMIQLLPSSYNQKRTVMLNYEVLRNIYQARKNHKLDEWRDFCKWIEGLYLSCLITGNNGLEDAREED